MARRPVNDAERLRIVKAIKAGQPRNEIARDFDRGAATISRIALAEGLSFERAVETASALEAKKADFAQRRTALRDRFFDEASQLLDQLHQPHVVISWYKGEAHEHLLAEPDTGGKKDLAIAAGIFVDKAIALDRDGSQDFSAVDAWLRGLIGDVTHG